MNDEEKIKKKVANLSKLLKQTEHPVSFCLIFGNFIFSKRKCEKLSWFFKEGLSLILIKFITVFVAHIKCNKTTGMILMKQTGRLNLTT